MEFHKINKTFEKEIAQAKIELWCDADRRAKLTDKEMAHAPTIGEILAMTI